MGGGADRSDGRRSPPIRAFSPLSEIARQPAWEWPGTPLPPATELQRRRHGRIPDLVGDGQVVARPRDHHSADAQSRYRQRRRSIGLDRHTELLGTSVETTTALGHAIEGVHEALYQPISIFAVTENSAEAAIVR